jgi:hypothetical protein
MKHGSLISAVLVGAATLLPPGTLSRAATFSGRPAVSNNEYAVIIGTRAGKGLEERHLALGVAAEILPTAGRQREYVAHLKSDLANILPAWVDKDQADAGTFNDWFAHANANFPFLSETSLIWRCALPTNWFAETPWFNLATSPHGWQGMTGILARLVWTDGGNGGTCPTTICDHAGTWVGQTNYCADGNPADLSGWSRELVQCGQLPFGYKVAYDAQRHEDFGPPWESGGTNFSGGNITNYGDGCAECVPGQVQYSLFGMKVVYPSPRVLLIRPQAFGAAIQGGASCEDAIENAREELLSKGWFPGGDYTVSLSLCNGAYEFTYYRVDEMCDGTVEPPYYHSAAIEECKFIKEFACGYSPPGGGVYDTNCTSYLYYDYKRESQSIAWTNISTNASSTRIQYLSAHNPVNPNEGPDEESGFSGAFTNTLAAWKTEGPNNVGGVTNSEFCLDTKPFAGDELEIKGWAVDSIKLLLKWDVSGGFDYLELP